MCLLWSPHLPAWEGSSFWWKHPALKRKPQPTGSIVIHDLQRLTPSPKKDIRYQKCPGTRKAIWKPMGRWSNGDIFIFSFLLIFLILPSIAKCATGQTCFQMPKMSKENKMDDNQKFLGRKDKGKKLLQDVVCTVGREEMKESGSWRRTSWEKRSGEV